MSAYELFSKRQKRLHGELPDVYSYDVIPPELRVQVIHIWGDTLGRSVHNSSSRQLYGGIHNYLCREYGCFYLGSRPYDDHETRLSGFLQTCTTEEALDVIEISFRVIDKELRGGNMYYAVNASIRADTAIKELNERFRWHGVGYQFESGLIIRVDSQILHSEAVKPALALLSESHYAGANAEFLNAFQHYRHGQTKECLTECLKAFESTMKAICTKRKWAFNANDTAKALIEVCFRENLIPPLIQSHISGFRSSLESGIPTVRNRLSGHGQGATVKDVPPYYASYMLHLTATTIKFLVEAEKAMK